jgi:hypothetical protein
LAFDAPPDRVLPAIAEAERWYAARGLPACFQLTEAFAPPGLDAALAAAGYARLTPTAVLLADAAALRRAALPGDPGVELLHRPGQGVLDAMADPLWDDARRRERAALLARIRRPCRLGLVSVGGEPAPAASSSRRRLAGLFALRTQAPFRRRGSGAGSSPGWSAGRWGRAPRGSTSRSRRRTPRRWPSTGASASPGPTATGTASGRPERTSRGAPALCPLDAGAGWP